MPEVVTAKKMDGTELNVGDEVTCDLYKAHRGFTLVISEINPFPGGCMSGYMVVAHRKDDPDNVIHGFKKEGWDPGPAGIDANHFKKIPENQLQNEK